MTDQHTPEALSAEPWDSLPSAERLGQMVKSADLSMRDQFGRHRSRTGYYWRDMGVALHALLRNHPPLAATLDAARASRPEPKDATPEPCGSCGRSRLSCERWEGGVWPCCGLCDHRRAAPAAPEGLRAALIEAAQYATCCYSVHEHDQPCPIGHDPVVARSALAATPKDTPDPIDEAAQRNDKGRVIALALSSQGYAQTDSEAVGLALLREIEEQGYTLRLTTADERRRKNDQGTSHE